MASVSDSVLPACLLPPARKSCEPARHVRHARHRSAIERNHDPAEARARRAIRHRDGRELARVEKKWAGLLQEAFTDADRFRIAFESPELGLDERSLVLAAGIFIDLQYFERKAN